MIKSNRLKIIMYLIEIFLLIIYFIKNLEFFILFILSEIILKIEIF